MHVHELLGLSLGKGPYKIGFRLLPGGGDRAVQLLVSGSVHPAPGIHLSVWPSGPGDGCFID